jgi:phosphoheptose isomerase
MEFTIGNSENVVKATNVANEMKVNTLIICGYDVEN